MRKVKEKSRLKAITFHFGENVFAGTRQLKMILIKMYVVMGPFSNSSLLEGVTTCLRFVERALGKAELIQTIFSITTQATNYE